jgi:hypothetical protein
MNLMEVICIDQREVYWLRIVTNYGLCWFIGADPTGFTITMLICYVQEGFSYRQYKCVDNDLSGALYDPEEGRLIKMMMMMMMMMIIIIIITQRK